MEFLFATASLFAVTLAASLIYYRRIKQAQGEYEDSKDLVKSITGGFTKQLTRIMKIVARIEQDVIKVQHSAEEALKAGGEALNTVREGVDDTSKLADRIEETEKTLDIVKTEIRRLSKIYRQPIVQKDVEAPIPLQRDNILEQLNPTEVEVLAIIEELGEGSVPEIRERIKKTREHTARLLKKLYEKGFIDRNTNRMPYRYNIRKEITEIIQQQKKKVKISV